jgi:CspA family cold shock protein
MRVIGKVKSFDRTTGVGCAVTDGGAQAAFTAAVLKPFGLSAIDEGAVLTFEMTLDGGRLRVAMIYEIAGAFGTAEVLEGSPVDRDVLEAVKRIQAAPPVMRVTGRVSSYNREKGFGFIATKDIDGDVLLHRSVLEAFGIDALLEGAHVDFDAVRKVKGYHAVRLHAVLPPEKPIDAAPFVTPPPVSGGCIVLDPEMLTRLTRFQVRPHTGGQIVVRGAKGFGFVLPSDDPWEYAVCKWFSRPKGYGFVRLEEGEEDIFVHMDTLRRHGMRALQKGQRVRVRVEDSERGLVVIEIELVEE